jgi:hypothetical protein
MIIIGVAMMENEKNETNEQKTRENEEKAEKTKSRIYLCVQFVRLGQVSKL